MDIDDGTLLAYNPCINTAKVYTLEIVEIEEPLEVRMHSDSTLVVGAVCITIDSSQKTEQL